MRLIGSLDWKLPGNLVGIGILAIRVERMGAGMNFEIKMNSDLNGLWPFAGF